MEADRGLTADYYFQLSIFLTDMWGMDTISVFEYFVFILDNKRNADYPCFWPARSVYFLKEGLYGEAEVAG